MEGVCDILTGVAERLEGLNVLPKGFGGGGTALATNGSMPSLLEGFCGISTYLSVEERSTHLRKTSVNPTIEAGIKPLPVTNASDPVLAGDLLAELVK